MPSVTGRSRLSKSLGEEEFRRIFLLLYGVWIIFWLHNHDLWRDELQAWLIAKYSATPFDIFVNTEYEGRPPLWHLILWPITKMTSNPDSMKIVAFCLSLSSAYLVLRCIRISRIQRVLILFGFYFSFGYTVLARDYGLVLLLAISTVYFTSVRKNHPMRYVSISLLGLVNIFGIIIATSFLLSESISNFLTKNDANLTTRIRQTNPWIISTFFIFLGIVSIRVPEDRIFGTNFHPEFRGSIVSLLRSVRDPIFPYIFHTNGITVIDLLTSLISLSMIIILFFHSSRDSKIFLLIAISLLSINSVFGYSLYWWHFGSVVLVLIVVVLNNIEANMEFKSYEFFSTRKKLYTIAIWLFLLLQAGGTLFGLGNNFTGSIPYSNVKSAAYAVDQFCNDNCTVISDSQVMGPPIGAYLNQPIVYAGTNELQYFSIWKKSNFKLVDSNRLLLSTKNILNPVILISELSEQDIPEGFQVVRTFKKSVWGDNYLIAVRE